MHWLDRIAGVFTARPRFYDPVFAEGWGDPDELRRLMEAAAEYPDVAPIDITWAASTNRYGLRLTEGSFESPGSEFLPESSHIAGVLRVEPQQPTGGTCLIMAAFNDHGFGTRIQLARRLARHNIASVLLENPYYGARRPGSGQPLRTVTDFYSMGAGAVLEGRAILDSLRRESDTPLGVAGYSMGGNIAALISATVPYPVATAGLAASHSPGPVWTDGLLVNAIAWDSLGGIAERQNIRSALGAVSALNFPPPPHASLAVLAAPAADGYIPRYAFEALHDHWRGSDLRWIKGGHASVLLWRKRELVAAIIDSFKRLGGEEPPTAELPD